MRVPQSLRISGYGPPASPFRKRSVSGPGDGVRRRLLYRSPAAGHAHLPRSLLTRPVRIDVVTTVSRRVGSRACGGRFRPELWVAVGMHDVVLPGSFPIAVLREATCEQYESARSENISSRKRSLSGSGSVSAPIARCVRDSGEPPQVIAAVCAELGSYDLRNGGVWPPIHHTIRGAV